MNKPAFLLAVYALSALLFSCATTAPVTSTEFSESSDWLSATVSYPQFPSFPVLSRAISDFVEADFSDFKEKYEQEWRSLDESNRSYDENYKTKPFEYAVSAYRPPAVSKRYVSAVILVWQYTGGAHGSSSLTSFVYDRDSDSPISSPADLGLDCEDLSRICRAELEKSIPVYSDDAEYRSRRTEWIRAGTEPAEQNFRTFTYDGKTLAVYFGEYQVAPYSEGIQRVEIEWEMKNH